MSWSHLSQSARQNLSAGLSQIGTSPDIGHPVEFVSVFRRVTVTVSDSVNASSSPFRSKAELKSTKRSMACSSTTWTWSDRRTQNESSKKASMPHIYIYMLRIKWARAKRKTWNKQQILLRSAKHGEWRRLWQYWLGSSWRADCWFPVPLHSGMQQVQNTLITVAKAIAMAVSGCLYISLPALCHWAAWL